MRIRKLLMILPAMLGALGSADAQMPAPSPVPVAVPATLPPASAPMLAAPPVGAAQPQGAPAMSAMMPAPAMGMPAMAGQAPAAAMPAPAPQPVDSGYIIGNDDMIEVSVLGAPDFTTRARVRADGTIALPYLGTVSVSGQTALSLGQMLSGRLRAAGIYANPVMNVEIVSFASRYVILLGEVASPGLQPVDRAYRVSEIIARAGGLRESGADFIVVTRANGTELKLPFEKLATGGEADDPLIQPGDKIFVPKAQTYYIYGQITSPGVYPIRGEMTLRKAIASGGGLTSMGSERRIKVFHDGREKKMTMDERVQPGDVIVVGERLF